MREAQHVLYIVSIDKASGPVTDEVYFLQHETSELNEKDKKAPKDVWRQQSFSWLLLFCVHRNFVAVGKWS